MGGGPRQEGGQPQWVWAMCMDGAVLHEHLGVSHESLGLGSPRAGIRRCSPVGREGGGSTYHGSDTALTPGGLRSERGQSSPAQSCDLFPILLDSVSSGTKGLPGGSEGKKKFPGVSQITSISPTILLSSHQRGRALLQCFTQAPCTFSPGAGGGRRCHHPTSQMRKPRHREVSDLPNIRPLL